MHDEQLLHRLARDGALRMAFRIAEHVEHHHAVGHRRKDRAEAVLAVEALADPRGGAIDRALARGQPRQQHGSITRSTMSTPRKNQNHDAFCCGAFGVGPRFAGDPRNSSSMPHALRVARHRPLRHQHQERHDHRARPVRNLVEVERKPARQQHDLDRHHRHRAPRHDAEQREHDAGEHVARVRRRRARGSPRARGACARRRGSSPIIFSAK